MGFASGPHIKSTALPGPRTWRRFGFLEWQMGIGCVAVRPAGPGPTVLLLLAKGYSQRGIASKLDVSDNTVRTHMRNLYRKLQIHSRQEAIELVEGFGRGEGVRGLS